MLIGKKKCRLDMTSQFLAAKIIDIKKKYRGGTLYPVFYRQSHCWN